MPDKGKAAGKDKAGTESGGSSSGIRVLSGDALSMNPSRYLSFDLLPRRC